MAKIQREKPNFVAIGAFLFTGLLLLVFGVVVADKLFYKLKGGYTIYLSFDNIDGVVVGSKLMIGGGKDIGQVDRIDLYGSNLVLSVTVNKNIKLNQDASFQIYSSSLMGGKYLGVNNYTGQAPHIEKETLIKGVTPFSFNKIFEVLGGKGDDATGDTNSQDMIRTLSSIVSSADRIVAGNETNITILIANLVEASRRLNNMAGNLDRKLSTISDAQLIKIIKDLEISLNQMQIFLSDINKPDAPLSVLKDPAMNHSLRTIITNLEYTTERVKKQPSLLLK